MKISLPGSSLQLKITSISVLLILFLATVVALTVRAQISTKLGEQLDRSGVALAKSLSAQSADLILVNDTFSLYELLESVLRSNEEVRYVLVLGPGGNVIAHTFGEGLPQGLVSANPGLLGGQEYSKVLLDTEEGRIRDIATPIFGGKAGTVRVGMSEAHLREAVAAATSDIALATALVLVVAIIAAYFLAALLTRPILALVKVVKAVGRGDLNQKAPVVGKDEVGLLSASFNAMTEELARSRERMQRDMMEKERMAQELEVRNRALSALNAVAAAVNQSLDLDQCLNITLGRVLEVIEVEAGWVKTLEDARGPALRAHRGLSAELVEKVRGLTERAPDSPAPGVSIKRIEEEPTLAPLTPEMGRAPFYASIPLSSKGQLLGTLYLLSRRPFTPEDMEMLSAIGQQVGTAIEKAQLHAQVQEVAILEERDRLGREMHDSLAQVTSYLNIKASFAEQALARGEVAKAQEELRDLRKVAEEAYVDIRDAILGLRTSIAPGRGILRTLTEYIDKFSRQHKIPVHIELPQENLVFSPAAEVQILRIVQEALTNVRKHAPQSSAWVRFEVKGGKATITIEDSGPGFDPLAVAQSKGQHFGLETMKERAHKVEGDFLLESRPGKGTKITVTLPLERRENVADKDTTGR